MAGLNRLGSPCGGCRQGPGLEADPATPRLVGRPPVALEEPPQIGQATIDIPFGRAAREERSPRLRPRLPGGRADGRPAGPQGVDGRRSDTGDRAVAALAVELGKLRPTPAGEGARGPGRLVADAARLVADAGREEAGCGGEGRGLSDRPRPGLEIGADLGAPGRAPVARIALLVGGKLEHQPRMTGGDESMVDVVIRIADMAARAIVYPVERRREIAVAERGALLPPHPLPGVEGVLRAPRRRIAVTGGAADAVGDEVVRERCRREISHRMADEAAARLMGRADPQQLRHPPRAPRVKHF